jgi:sporulation protein YlmC with PRC-barrel domain
MIYWYNKERMMLRSVNELQGYTIHATDGEIGGVDQCLFDDEQWTVRYFVIDTGSWLPGRQVLISPISIKTVNWAEQELDVTLTREQVEHSPDINTDLPVSRQKELEYLQYYGYMPYWGGVGLWGPGMYPGYVAYPPAAVPAPPAPATTATEEQTTQPTEQGDPHLRSSREVTGYYIQASDGEIGHVDDLLVDDETWAVRYMIVDTKNWWPGKKVLISPRWISEISWATSQVRVDLSREAIKNAPEFDPSRPVSREYEAQLHNYYGRPIYWDAIDRR